MTALRLSYQVDYVMYLVYKMAVLREAALGKYTQ